MNKKYRIKVMHVAQATGGVERYLQMLLKYFDRDKFENILVCSYDYKAEHFKGIVDKLIQIDMGRSIGLNDLKASGKVRKLIKQYRPDIVYGHSSKAGAIVRLADIGVNNKCVYNPHGWAFNMHVSCKKKKIYIMMERAMTAFCDKIICISDAEKRSAFNHKICKSDKLEVIYNGIDIEQYDLEKEDCIKRESLGIPDDAIVVGTVGRLTEQKSPDIFIKMAEKLKEKINNIYFIMVGDGEEKQKTLQYAKNNGLEKNLIITGWVEKPMKYIKLFDIAVLFSRWEGFGLVLAEYMLVEKPIVATQVDAIPDIIKDRKNGLLVRANDVEDICNKVLELIIDEKLKKQLIEFEKKDVRNRFDIRRVVEQHENLFINLLKN